MTEFTLDAAHLSTHLCAFQPLVPMSGTRVTLVRGLAPVQEWIIAA